MFEKGMNAGDPIVLKSALKIAAFRSRRPPHPGARITDSTALWPFPSPGSRFAQITEASNRESVQDRESGERVRRSRNIKLSGNEPERLFQTSSLLMYNCIVAAKRQWGMEGYVRRTNAIFYQ
jgi:hypothetical protein